MTTNTSYCAEVSSTTFKDLITESVITHSMEATRVFSNGSSPNNTTALASSYSGENLLVFQVIVTAVGSVGMLANGFVAGVLHTLTGNKKERFNILMLNQTILDMFSCAMLTAIYATRIANIYLTSLWGHLLCILFLAETPLWVGLNGSQANLVIIAVERYLKIVHPIWHKNNVRSWMIYSAVAFSWIEGILQNVPVVTTTSQVIDGQCYSVISWPSQKIAFIYSVYYFIFVEALPIPIFCFCYGRIVAVVVRQARILKSTTTVTTSQLNANRAKMNVVKTMVTLTTMFSICWMPISVYYLLTIIKGGSINTAFYQVGMFWAVLSICINPFVYAGQSDVIRRRMGTMWASSRDLASRLAAYMQQRVPTVHPAMPMSIAAFQDTIYI